MDTDNTEKESFVGRLLQETYELFYRMSLLNKFIYSDKFLELSEVEQELLLEQYRAMEKYHEILCKRYELIRSSS